MTAVTAPIVAQSKHGSAADPFGSTLGDGEDMKLNSKIQKLIPKNKFNFLYFSTSFSTFATQNRAEQSRGLRGTEQL